MNKAIARTKASYNAVAKTYTENTRPFNECIMHQEILRLMRKHNFEFEGRVILDAGCGPGGLMKRIEKFGSVAYGIDLSEELLRIAASRKLSNLLCGSMHEADEYFAPAMFDAVVSNFALHYLPLEGQALAMKSFYRISKPGAIFVASLAHPFFLRNGYFDSKTQSFPSRTTNYFKPQTTDAWGKEEKLGRTLHVFRTDWPQIHRVVHGAGYDVLELAEGVLPSNPERLFRGIKVPGLAGLIRALKRNPFAVFVVARK